MLYTLLDNPGTQDWLEANGLYPLVMVMYQLEFRAFIAVVVSFLIVITFGPRVIRWLVKQKVGDSPEFYVKDLNELMKSKKNTPTMGGLLICASILITILLFADLRNFYVIVGLAVLLWLSALGGVDDWLKLTSARRSPGSREGLYAWEKLLFQLGIAGVAGVFLYIHGTPGTEMDVLTLPFQRTYIPDSKQLSDALIHLPFLAFVIVATLVIAGTSNAVNISDGMDGLAPGTLIIASFAVMILCYIAGSASAAERLLVPFIDDADEMTVITGAMAGALLGFLWFNCHPAQVFMGDTGSLPLGGLLAYIAVAIRQEVLLIIIGGVFFMEMGSVMLQVGFFKWTKRREGNGRRLFRVAPIHHHFHMGGWSEQQVVTRFWILAVVFAAVALVSIKLR